MSLTGDDGLQVAYDGSSVVTDAGLSIDDTAAANPDASGANAAGAEQAGYAQAGAAAAGVTQLGHGLGQTLAGSAGIGAAAFDPGSPAARSVGTIASGAGALNEIAGGLQSGGLAGAVGVAQGGATAVETIDGQTSAAGQAAGALAGELNAVGAVLGGVRSGGVSGDLNAAGGVARLGADVAGSGSAVGAGLAGAASGIGAAVGLYEGFKTDGAVGGAEAGIGAAAALELAGAASGIGLPIAAGVALVAAIFGGNHDNPANMPDKYDTQRYGQDIADLQGVAGANGQSFTEGPQLEAALGRAYGYRGGRRNARAVRECVERAELAGEHVRQAQGHVRPEQHRQRHAELRARHQVRVGLGGARDGWATLHLHRSRPSTRRLREHRV